jgi:hypothetical protein
VAEHDNFFRNLALIGAGVALYEIGNSAFSKPVRDAIIKRDGGKSVWSGETEDLEAAHISHDKNDPYYDDASNGRTLTHREQYIDHFNRHGTVSIGSSESENKSSLGIIYHTLDEEKREGLPPPKEAGTTLIPLPKKQS